ncbi:MAG: Rpn family recombination-promoting nuclease/putative transposase [Myxococcota bacterium]
MRFIDPRTDFAFKKIFGTAGHEDVLRSLLNALLYGGRDEITGLTLQDPYNIPRLKGLKDSYLDVRIRQNDGKWVLVEMQVVNVPGFEQRVLFNAAKQYSNQVVKGEDYGMLEQVVVLTITDFVMFSDWPKIKSCYRLFEKDLIVEYPTNGMELVFVELPKFTKTHEQAVDLWEKWLCFLKEAGSLEMVPDSLAEIPEIKEAFQIANYASLTREEANIFDNKAWWRRDQKILSKLYEEQKTAYEQVKTKHEQVKTKHEQMKTAHEQMKTAHEQMKTAHEQAKAERDKVRQTLRQTALALRQSGMDNARIRAIMGITEQDLRNLL